MLVHLSTIKYTFICKCSFFFHCVIGWIHSIVAYKCSLFYSMQDILQMHQRTCFCKCLGKEIPSVSGTGTVWFLHFQQDYDQRLAATANTFTQSRLTLESHRRVFKVKKKSRVLNCQQQINNSHTLSPLCLKNKVWFLLSHYIFPHEVHQHGLSAFAFSFRSTAVMVEQQFEGDLAE